MYLLCLCLDVIVGVGVGSLLLCSVSSCFRMRPAGRSQTNPHLAPPCTHKHTGYVAVSPASLPPTASCEGIFTVMAQPWCRYRKEEEEQAWVVTKELLLRFRPIAKIRRLRERLSHGIFEPFWDCV